MSDEFERDKKKEVDEFLSEFDKIADGFEKRLSSPDDEDPAATSSQGDSGSEKPDISLSEDARQARAAGIKEEYGGTGEAGSRKKSSGTEDAMADRKAPNRTREAYSQREPESGKTANGKNGSGGNGKKKKKKYRLRPKRLLITLLLLCILAGGTVAIWTASVIASTPKIDTDNIYTMLSENSILYDDKGSEIENLFAGGGGLRTNLNYSEMPQDLLDAFVAIEDKTFWEHGGFNVVRIFGAILDGVFSGESIRGTSTITQQLARNLYLEDKKSIRTLTRKIQEAYYAIQLERQLSKEQIIEAYLNTIYMGSGANGVQAASQTYFSKDVDELTLAECAVLASIPKHPLKYSPIKRLDNEDIPDPDSLDFIYRGDSFSILYQSEFGQRQQLVLQFMKDQEFITAEEYSEAAAENIRDSIKPNINAAADISSYFADYVVKQVIEGLMYEYDIDEETAKNMIYNGGLRIYSTLNVDMQKIAEKEFKNNKNFPTVSGLKKDKAGNVLDTSGKILLYLQSNLIDANGDFILTSDEYRTNENGDLVLLKGHRLNFYKTEVQGKVDHSVEFKSMYVVQDGIFYSIPGGYLLIPAEYKSRDEEGNLILSKEYFSEGADTNEKLVFGKDQYQLKEKVIQPQSAMVIMDYKTGGIKAMVGGRSLAGKLLYNRATATRQPGSAIKPMAVYGPALQRSVDLVKSGGDTGGMKLWTAASIIDDAPYVVQDKLWPKNWYDGYRGLYTLRQSVEQSVNVNAVKVFTDIGPAASLAFLKKLGVTSVVESGNVNDMNAAALALGGMTKGISPLQMTAAYGTFPNQGLYTKPISYTSVTDKKGDVLLEGTASKEQVMDRGAAFIMTDILRTTVSSGIAGSAAIGSHPTAGKTGTTSDNYDAWFVGFTPHYAAALWIGNDINLELSQGSVSAARLWSKIMKQVHTGLPAGSFPTAENVQTVTVDTKSGKLPSELSSLDPRGTVRSEYFVEGTAPIEIDDVHVSVTVCGDSGYLATPYCPHQQAKVMIRRPEGSVISYGSVVVGDIAYEAPSYYCNLHNLDPGSYPISPDVKLSTDYSWYYNGGEEDSPLGPVFPNLPVIPEEPVPPVDSIPQNP